MSKTKSDAIASCDEPKIARLLQVRHRSLRQAECAQLELVALASSGVATTEEQKHAKAHLQECSECADSVLWLTANLSSLESPAKTVTAKTSWWQQIFSQMVPWQWAAAAAAVVLVVATPLVWWPESEVPGKTSTLLVKGQADQLFVAVQRGAQRFAAQPEQRLLAGDKLGLFYTADKAGYLLIFGVANKHGIARLYPAKSSSSIAIDAGHRVAIPDGVEVQPGQGCEWLVAVFSEQPLDHATVEPLLKQAQVKAKNCQLDVAIQQARSVTVFPVLR